MSGWLWSDLDVRVIDRIHPWSRCLYPAITNKIKQLVSSKKCWMSFLPTHGVWHGLASSCLFSADFPSWQLAKFSLSSGPMVHPHKVLFQMMTRWPCLLPWWKPPPKKQRRFWEDPKVKYGTPFKSTLREVPFFSQYCLLWYAKGVVPGLC